MIEFQRVTLDGRAADAPSPRVPYVRLWVGGIPRYREIQVAMDHPYYDGETITVERPPDAIVPVADMDHLVIEWLRGPMGHPGPTGATGMTGPSTGSAEGPS